MLYQSKMATRNILKGITNKSKYFQYENYTRKTINTTKFIIRNLSYISRNKLERKYTVVLPNCGCLSYQPNREHSGRSNPNSQKVILQTSSPKIDLRSSALRSQDGESLRSKCDSLRIAVDPYIQLMRMDKPIGTWLLFWPCSWSIMLASDPAIVPLSHTATNMALFLVGSFIMRGAGCTINDLWDKDIDGKVERTKDRPLVSGVITQKRAIMFLAAQLSAGLAILLQLNWYSVALGASSMALVVTYPLAKRFTDYPQVFLGMTFNWGALLGYTAMRGELDPTICLPLYAGALCWTVVYDTIYAHQDKNDDARIGIKSTALTFGENTRSRLTLAGITSASLFTTAGIAAGLGWEYYAALAIASAHVGRQISTLKMDNPSDCALKFKSNSLVGLIIFLGILAAKWDTLTGTTKENIEEAIDNESVEGNHEDVISVKS